MEYIPCNTGNYAKGRSSAVKYIVIHYTGNKGDTARNNCNYFKNNVVKASAHYFVYENEILLSVKEEDTAWAVGDGKGQYGITNSNSISIEMCNFVTINEKVLERTLPLVRELMKKYNIGIKNVVRHWDASRKQCPLPYYGENNVNWKHFKELIEQKNEEEKMLKELINEGFTEEEVTSAVRDLMITRRDNGDTKSWKIEGADWLNKSMSEPHNHKEPITFGVLGTILRKTT